jgi:hypothetical protein
MIEIQETITFIVQAGITEFATRYEDRCIVVDFEHEHDALAFKMRYGGPRLTMTGDEA